MGSTESKQTKKHVISAIDPFIEPNHSDIGQFFSDNQWIEHHQELSRLVCRKLAPYLSPQEQEALWLKLCGVNHAQPVSGISMAPNPVEIYMLQIYDRFGVTTLRQLVRYAIFTSEEEIAAYFAS